MPEPDGKSNASETKLTVKLDDGTEKQLGPDDVKNLLAQQASATQKTQQVAAVMKVCEKYGAKPEDFAREADAAFERMSGWKDQGYLDDEWNIVKEKVQESHQTNQNNFSQNAGNSSPNVDLKKEELIAEATKPFQDKITKLEGTLGQLIDMNLSKEVETRFPDLGLQGARYALHLSRKDKSKSLEEHCEALIAQKKDTEAAARKKYAEEFGVDLSKFDENKLNQQGADGGMLPMFKGKRFSLTAKKGDKDKMQPADAAEAYIRAKFSASD